MTVLDTSLAGDFRERLRQRISGHRELQAVLSGATQVFIIRLIGAALAYLSLALMARWLGTFEFGIYAYVWVWIVTLGILLSLGYYSTALRFIPDYLARGRWRRLNGFLNQSYRVVGAAGVAGALLGPAIVLAARDQIAPYYILPLLIGAACLPMSALLVQLEAAARAFGWVHLAYVPGYIVRPLLLIFVIGGAVAMGIQPTAADALWGVLLACLIAAVAQGMLLLWRQRRLIPPVRPLYHTRVWARLSLSFLVIEGFHLLLDSTDVVIVGQLLDPASVGIYFAAIRTGGLIAFIYFAVSAIAVPRIAQIHATGTREEMQLFVSGVIRLMFWPSVAAAALLVLIGPFALSLFGPEFQGGYGVLLVVLVGLVARAATGPVEYLLNMTGHEKDTVRVYAVAAVGNIALNFTLIPQLGIIGAAISTYVAVIGANICLCWLVRRRLGVISFVSYGV